MKFPFLSWTLDVYISLQLHFQHHQIKDLKNLYLDFFPEEERSWREWDYSIETIKIMAMELDEDNEKKEEFLQRLNTAVVGLSFPPFSPMQETMHKCGLVSPL
jgi:hypothetical protein